MTLLIILFVIFFISNTMGFVYGIWICKKFEIIIPSKPGRMGLYKKGVNELIMTSSNQALKIHLKRLLFLRDLENVSVLFLVVGMFVIFFISAL